VLLAINDGSPNVSDVTLEPELIVRSRTQ
jgi:hypothetical protein